MTYWQIGKRMTRINDAESAQVRRPRTYGLVHIVEPGKALFVALHRLNRPEVCSHGHPIPATDVLVTINPVENLYGAPTKFCLNHAPIPHVKFLAVKPKGR